MSDSSKDFFVIFYPKGDGVELITGSNTDSVSNHYNSVTEFIKNTGETQGSSSSNDTLSTLDNTSSPIIAPDDKPKGFLSNITGILKKAKDKVMPKIDRKNTDLIDKNKSQIMNLFNTKLTGVLEKTKDKVMPKIDRKHTDLIDKNKSQIMNLFNTKLKGGYKKPRRTRKKKSANLTLTLKNTY